MTTEIERRFLLDEMPLGPGAGVRLRQGYLALDGDVAVRVREAGAEHRLTVKGGDGLRRTEVELPIAPEEFEALWRLTGGRHIEKTRYRVPVGEHVAEVDVFAGPLEGLMIAEVEFDGDEAAAEFAPPAWFGREVTGEREWGNAALALHGRPPAA